MWGSGWAGWGVRTRGPVPPTQPPAPLTATPGTRACCQPESIFIPCLKISQSRSLAHDGSSLLRLPPGSSQLRDEKQSQASCESPPQPSHPRKAPRGHGCTHAVGVQEASACSRGRGTTAAAPSVPWPGPSPAQHPSSGRGASLGHCPLALCRPHARSPASGGADPAPFSFPLICVL